MEESLSLPSEPRLSNSLLKSRPIPAARSAKKSKKPLELPIGLDEAVPLDGKIFIKKSLFLSPLLKYHDFFIRFKHEYLL